MITSDGFSRAQKLLVDRDNLSLEEAERRFLSFQVTLVCGDDVASSPTLQAAVLTAANTANKIRPGSVTVAMSDMLKAASPLVPWPARTFGEALISVAPEIAFQTGAAGSSLKLVFGSAECERGLRITFNGWAAAVGPVKRFSRLPEKERCVLAGVAAGALGVSEIFMSVFGVALEAGTRTTGFSLWRPDLPFHDALAVGPKIEYLPNEVWSLGLGHLGQAYLWCLGLLPYSDPRTVNILLQDFDRTVMANVGTCALTKPTDITRFKTRVCADWLEPRNFLPRVLERAFDEYTHCTGSDPELALCGFDGRGPRHLLDEAGFRRVVECGLGGRFDNFDSILIHSLPREMTSARTLWPADQKKGNDTALQNLLKNNVAYQFPEGTCGVIQMDLAMRSVAVPFVGAIAGAFVLAETIRMGHGGERFEMIDFRLSNPRSIRFAKASRDYGVDLTRLDFREALQESPGGIAMRL